MKFDEEIATQGVVHVIDLETQSQGTGVLIDGGCVLTAAHNFYPKMPDPTAFRQCARKIEVQSLNREKKALLLIAQSDTCMDSAILGAVGLHASLFDDETEDYEEFKRHHKSQPIELIDTECCTCFEVWIYSHDTKWTRGSAIVDVTFPHFLLIDAEGAVQKGMSGGPVFNANGKVVGCLLGACDKNKTVAFANMFSTCLPGWALSAHRRQLQWLTKYSKWFGGIDLDRHDTWKSHCLAGQ